jgi:hypothetical protein
MNPREAMKEVLRNLFEWLEEDKNISYTKEQIDNAVEIIHDDNIFIEDLIDFFEEHLETFCENYQL